MRFFGGRERNVCSIVGNVIGVICVGQNVGLRRQGFGCVMPDGPMVLERTVNKKVKKGREESNISAG
jgi:hypothetical protein